MSPDLVEHLAHAAAEAVRARRGAILSSADRLSGITVELEVANGGEVIDVAAHVTRRHVHRYHRETAVTVEKGTCYEHRSE